MLGDFELRIQRVGQQVAVGAEEKRERGELPKWRSTRKTTTCMQLRRKQIAHLSPDGPRVVPYPERENRMVTEHHRGAVEAGPHETVMMNDQDKR